MKKLIKGFSLVLVVFLLLTSVTACKKSDNTSSEIESGLTSENIETNVSSTDENVGEGNDSQTDNSSKVNTPQKVDPALTGVTVDPSKYRGTTIKYATWKDPSLNEDGPVIKAFTKKYGINVEIVNVPQKNYVEKITALIASGKAPDVFIETAEFPAILSIAQPLDATKLDLTNPIWDQTTIKMNSINGKSYGLHVVGSLWAEASCTVFNKKLMEDNNITTPAEYYAAGKWNFDTLYKVLQDCKAAGFKGGFLNPDVLAASFGADWVTMSNGVATNNSGNNMLATVYQFIAKCNKEGLLVKARDYFNDGNVGISIDDAFSLKKTGHYASMNQNHIGFTYLPDYNKSVKAQPTATSRSYGICKKAKNPEAAGIFLRYYLDSNNYDTRKAFFSTEASTFFFDIITAASTKKQVWMLNGVGTICGSETLRGELTSIAYEDPSQVGALIAAKKNLLDGYVSKVNAHIKSQTGN
mgnify:CR=1 FL=1